MSAAVAADLERAVREICDRHGVERRRVLELARQILDLGEPRVVFRAVEEEGDEQKG